MCLIVIAWRCHPAHPLVVGANRDEFHARPTLPAGFWCDAPGICAGRDLQAGGTWLGITRGGRFAALTNYRGNVASAADAPSRGELVSGFLRSSQTPGAFLEQLQPRAARFAGFNLLLGVFGGELCYFSNIRPAIRRLEPGIYGLSNHLLDTPWPKVRSARAALQAELARGPTAAGVFGLLADRSQPADEELPDTGVGPERERELAPSFIVAGTYGTRASSYVRVSGEGIVDFEEHSFDAQGMLREQVAHRFGIG